MNLPNILTMSRMAAVPVIVALLFQSGDGYRWAALAVFVSAAVTDWLDGFLARSLEQQSSLGRLFDPIADKVLVAAVLLMLAGQGMVAGLTLVPAVAILMREVIVTGLREYLAEQGVPMPVSRLAKWKTAVQCTALGFLIVGDTWLEPLIRVIGEAGLWLAAALTVITGYDYLVTGLRSVTAPGSTSS